MQRNSARLPAPIILIGGFPDLPRQKIFPDLPRYFENYAEMDSTHRELYFLLLSASQLSKRSSGGLGEVKNCRWESQNCASRDLSRRRNSNRPPETVAGTHRNTKSGRHPSHSRSVTPPTRIVWNFQSVNNGGDEMGCQVRER